MLNNPTPLGLASIDHPSVWLIAPTVALLSGQSLVSVAPAGVPLGAWLLIGLVAVWLVFANRRHALLVFIASAFFVSGYVRHRDLLHPSFPANHLRSVMAHHERLYIEGRLVQEPEKLPNRNRWLLRTQRIWHPAGAEEITGDLLVSVRHSQREWHYGDRIRFWARPLAPRNSGNPGGFNYATYLARRSIYAVVYLENDSEVDLLARDPGRVWGTIESLRREIRRFIDRRFAGENGALLKALVIGDMGGIGREMRGAFTAAGVSHVLSISGLHVAMLGLVVFALVRLAGAFSTALLLRWNLLKIATFCSFIAVIFYTGLAGAMVPTVRSAIMIGIYELAVLLDREEEIFASLALAALLIGLAWPGVIADVSFQLSFLAVLSIVWGTRKLYQRSKAVAPADLPQERSWLKERLRQAALYMAVPLLATLGTGPLIAHYFGHLSLAGFIANPLVVPLVGFVVVPLGLAIGLLAVTLPAAAAPLVWLAEPVLEMTLRIVDAFARLPLANLSVPSPNAWEVAALYCLIITVVALRSSRIAGVAFAVVFIAVVVDAAYWWRERWHRRELRLTQLSVGQGDAAVVELPGSKVLLIDAGGSALGDFDPGEAIVAPFLRSRKILSVDYLILSHPRIDHYGGMPSIVREFAPREFWSAGEAGTARFEELEQVLSKSRIERVALHAARPCRELDEVRACFLYPPNGDGDRSSLVFRLEFGRARFLFSGDIEKRDEDKLLRDPDGLTSAVLKVPRHGSAAASSAAFVAAVRPRLAIISVGARNAQGLPRQEVLERYRSIGADVLRTDEDGAIIVETDGHAVRYRTYGSGKQGTITF